MGQDSRGVGEPGERGGTLRLKGPVSLGTEAVCGMFVGFVSIGECAERLPVGTGPVSRNFEEAQQGGTRKVRRSWCQGHFAQCHCHCCQEPLASWPVSLVRFGVGQDHI